MSDALDLGWGFLKAFGRFGKATGKVALGSTGSRIALGAAIGGAYGYATNPYNDPNASLGYIARSAFYGGAIGGATRLFTPARTANGWTGTPLGIRAASSAMNSAFNGSGLKSAFLAGDMKGFASQFSSSPAGRGVNGLGTAAGLAMRYPGTAMGLAAGAVALNAFNSMGPALSTNISMFSTLDSGVLSAKATGEEQQIQNESNMMMPMGQSMSGTAIRNQRLMQSTVGMVQGLHQGRHSGG